MMGNPYSNDKMTWWMVREGFPPSAPKQAQVIISDLCSQSCTFCLVAGTMVATPTGDIPIEQLRPGDVVYGPDGSIQRVTNVSERKVEAVSEITIGDLSIRASTEHPVLTRGGWKKAGDLNVGDHAVVRVRMREYCPLSSRLLESLCLTPSGKSWAGRSWQASHQREDACEQSHAASGGRREDVGVDDGSLEAEVGAGASQYRSGCAQANAGLGTGAIEERAALLGVGSSALTVSGPHGSEALGSPDRSSNSGLQSAGSAESGRGGAKDVLQRRRHGSAYSGRLRTREDRTLPIERVGVPSGIQAGSSVRDPSGPRDGDQELYLAGILLERGLALRPIDSVRRIDGRVTVYNISCPPVEAFEANGIVVHNCAYRFPGHTSNQLFTKDAELSAYGHDNPKRFIPTAKVLEILADCKKMGVLGVQFTGGGEPTVHPEHERIFEAALSLDLKCALVSNGLRWSEHLIQDILPNFSWVRVSVDAGQPHTYERMRQTTPVAWGKVWGHIKALAAARYLPATGHAAEMVLGIGFVVTPDNHDEIEEAVVLTRDAGAAYIRLSAMFSPLGATPYEPIYAHIRRLIDRSKVHETADFVIHDLFGDRVEDLIDGAPDYDTCAYQHYTTFIGGDQNVYRCCVMAYNERGLLGSIKERSFKEFWEDPKTQGSLTNFNARGCSVCQFNDKNRRMNGLLEIRPMHIEFP